MRYLLELETNGPFEMWDRLIWINSLLPEEQTFRPLSSSGDLNF